MADLENDLQLIEQFRIQLGEATAATQVATDNFETFVTGGASTTIPTDDGPLESLTGQVNNITTNAQTQVNTAISGYDSQVAAAIVSYNTQVDNYLLTLGFQPPVQYTSGIVITERSQTVSEGGLTYFWSGSLPHTTTGDFDTETDFELAPAVGGVREPAFDFATGGTLNSRSDSVQGLDGQWYYWAGTLPKIIPAGSTLTSAGGLGSNAFNLVAGFIDPRTELERHIAGTGHTLNPQNFERGATLISTKELLYEYTTGKLWKWVGAVPKVVNAGDTPASSGGVSGTTWVDFSSLIKMYQDSTTFASLGYNVVGDFAEGHQLTGDTQYLINTDSQVYVWRGTFPHTVTAGTDPTTIPNFVSINLSTNDRAVHLTLAQAQASTLRDGQYIVLTDHGYGLYQMVPLAHTGGYYKTGFSDNLKAQLIIPSNELRLSWIGQLSGDATTELQSFASISDDLDVVFDYELDCSVTSVITFANAKSIDFGELTKISFDGLNWPVQIGSYTMVEKLDSLTTIPEFTTSLVLTNTTDVGVGSVLAIWDSTDGAWNGARTEYRRGELIRVRSVTGNVASLQTNVIDSYPVGVQVFLVSGAKKIDVTGSLEVTKTNTVGGTGLALNGLMDSSLTGLNVTANNCSIAVRPLACLNLTGEGLRIAQLADTVGGSGTGYGLALTGCQIVKLSGDFHGVRHGVTTVSDGSDGLPINRFGLVFGNVTNSAIANTQAADVHGNTEYWSYGGYLEGYLPRGNHTTLIPKTRIVSPSPNIVPVQFSELKGTNHNLDHAVITMDGESTGRGIIECGGGGDAGFNANTTLGGTISLRNASINGNTTTQGAVRIRNRGSAATNIDVDLHGVEVNVPNSSTMFVFDTVSGQNLRNIDLTSSEAWKGTAVSGVLSGRYIGLEQFGETGSISIPTGVSFVSQAVTFPDGFPTPSRVVVTICDFVDVVGSKRTNVTVHNITDTGFTAIIYSTDGTNFDGSTTTTIRYHAIAY